MFMFRFERARLTWSELNKRTPRELDDWQDPANSELRRPGVGVGPVRSNTHKLEGPPSGRARSGKFKRSGNAVPASKRTPFFVVQANEEDRNVAQKYYNRRDGIT